MRNLVQVNFLLVVFLLTNCKGLERESKAWRDQVQATVIALQESVDAVAMAVPGERWARQMEALTDPDPAVRQRALDEIASGVSASLGKPLTVRATIGSQDSEAIRARFFLTPTNQLAELESFCRQGAFVSLDVWKNTLTRPRTPEERRQAARMKATEFLDTVLGTPRIEKGHRLNNFGHRVALSRVTWAPPKLVGTGFLPAPPGKDVAEGTTQELVDVTRRREKAISALAELMLVHYGEIELGNSGDTLEHSWSSTEGHGVLHVVIPESDLERLREIRAWIHEEGKPDSTLDGMTPRVLKVASFEQLPAEIANLCLPEDEELHWVAVDLSRAVYHSTPSAHVVEQLARLRESVDKLKQIYDAEVPK